MSLPFAAAADNNKDAILDALKPRLAADARVLEIGSGTGQHAVHFADAMPDLSWQPTDLAENLTGIRGWIDHSGLHNVSQPLVLDVCQRPWPEIETDHCYSANTLHIMPWQAVQTMFAGIADLLPAEGRLFVYGPFLDGENSAASNLQFDLALRQQHAGMGVRELADLRTLAAPLGLSLIEQVAMPRDNALLVFRREA